METSLENDINETTSKLEKISFEDIQSRHRKERKELQAKIQALKKNAPKSDKKKRKEALEEIAKLESDLEKRQEKEIEDAENEREQAVPEEQPGNGNDTNLTDDINEEVRADDQQLQQRVTKAQKRREKKAREARQREKEIKACAENALHAPKAIEARKLQMILKERGLATHSVPSDGDCLYNAIRHQLIQHGLSSLSVKELRCLTADYIKANKDNLIPYMTNPETGYLLTGEQFEKYCDDIRNTPAWGGQIELKALSSTLKVPIVVLQADGSPTIQGAEFDSAPLTITYHRHMYSLGEHYNSTIPTIPTETGNGEDDNN